MSRFPCNRPIHSSLLWPIHSSLLFIYFKRLSLPGSVVADFRAWQLSLVFPCLKMFQQGGHTTICVRNFFRTSQTSGCSGDVDFAKIVADTFIGFTDCHSFGKPLPFPFVVHSIVVKCLATMDDFCEARHLSFQSLTHRLIPLSKTGEQRKSLTGYVQYACARLSNTVARVIGACKWAASAGATLF